jgi:RHS repeat-associated protein
MGCAFVHGLQALEAAKKKRLGYDRTMSGSLYLNTPRLVEDQNQQPVWTWQQGEPFGDSVPNQTPASAGAFVFNVRFPGQYFDQETNTSYNNRRDYNASDGRYVQSDLIGLGGGINTYSYVGGNPNSYVDIFGLGSVYRSSGHSYSDTKPGNGICIQAVFAGGFIVDWIPCDPKMVQVKAPDLPPNCPPQQTANANNGGSSQGTGGDGVPSINLPGSVPGMPPLTVGLRPPGQSSQSSPWDNYPGFPTPSEIASGYANDAGQWIGGTAADIARGASVGAGAANSAICAFINGIYTCSGPPDPARPSFGTR